MSIGSFVRAVSGPFERRLCAAYRAVFINVARCTSQIQRVIPRDAEVIDVGGGDGEVLNHLLRSRLDIRVAMLDLRNNIGMFLDPAVRDRVSLHPGTSLAEYRRATHARADVVLVSDVVHHIPPEDRQEFVRDCIALLRPSGFLLIKDVAPGGLISLLSVMADRYITGDRHVSLLGQSQLVGLVESQGLSASDNLLAKRDSPNYAIVFGMGMLPAV